MVPGSCKSAHYERANVGGALKLCGCSAMQALNGYYEQGGRPDPQTLASLVGSEPEGLGQRALRWLCGDPGPESVMSQCILPWGDSARESPRVVADHDVWLVQTERREPYGQNTDPSRKGSWRV